MKPLYFVRSNKWADQLKSDRIICRKPDLQSYYSSRVMEEVEFRGGVGTLCISIGNKYWVPGG